MLLLLSEYIFGLFEFLFLFFILSDGSEFFSFLSLILLVVFSSSYLRPFFCVSVLFLVCHHQYDHNH